MVFTNDNGAPNYINVEKANYPYRGWKASLFEGGIKMPLFMRYPAGISPGQQFAPVVSLIDIYPTVAAAAHIPLRHGIDGVNLLPHLSAPGNTSAGDSLPLPQDAVHPSLFWRSGHYKAYRRGQYKLQVSLRRPERVWLFDMAADPTEQVDLAEPGAAATHPEAPGLLAWMMRGLEEEEARHRAPLWPSLSETPVLIDRISGDYRQGDEYVYWAN